MAAPQAEQGLEEEGDVPPEIGEIDKHHQDADKLQPHGVAQQAGKVNTAAQSANDLGDDLKVFHEDVQRHWGGKDADAVCDHLEQIRSGVHKVGQKAEAAKEALDRVSEIMQHVKSKVKSIAEDAKTKNDNAQKLIQDTRRKKHSSKDDNEIQGAATEIERLRADNKKMSGQAKEDIERALNQAEQQIDQVLAPLGMEIDSGLIEMKPAGTPSGVTNPQGAGAPQDAGAPIGMPQSSSGGLDGGGSTTAASAGGAPSGGGAATGGATTSSSGSSGGSGASGGPPSTPVSGNVKKWLQQAKEILAKEGIKLDDTGMKSMEIIIQHESSGNPHAINLTDSNAAKGQPSKGLCQCIDSTFNENKVPGHDDIYNPVDNICASVKYQISRYGSMENTPGVKSVKSGGGYVPY